MANSFAGIVYSIIREVEEMANKIARGVAAVAFEDLQTAHSEIMNCFYGGYTPVTSYYFRYYKDGILYAGTAPGYRRTGNLKSNSIIP